MKRRILLVVLAIAITIVGCSKEEVAYKGETKEETKVSEEETDESVEEDAVEDVAEEVVEEEKAEEKSEEKTEEKNENTSNENNQKKPTATSQTAKQPAVNTPAATPTPSQPENKVETCEHSFNLESKSYEYVKEMVWACNGCGYPLFTIENGKPVHFSNKYSHPACYSEKLGGECTGGGYHSEIFHSGYCGVCHDEIMWRQCMFSDTGNMCMKNEALGAYQKVETGDNPRAFWKSCSCGRNQVYVGQATLDNNYGGLLLVKEVCRLCGYTVNYPKK